MLLNLFDYANKIDIHTFLSIIVAIGWVIDFVIFIVNIYIIFMIVFIGIFVNIKDFSVIFLTSYFLFTSSLAIFNTNYKKNCKQLIILFDEYEQKMAINMKIILNIFTVKGILRVIKIILS